MTKLALAVAAQDAQGREQRCFYHRGVGTSPRERFVGGTFGAGLSRDIRDAYRFLVRNYEPGDELFFFGFSRGAFTARSTVGFIRNCGILRCTEIDRVDEAYALYRSRRPTAHPRSIESTLFRRSYSHETRVAFIGVWDTVGALGIPFDGLRAANLINRRWQFHDTTLSAIVDNACHALAIDEQRGPFRPTLWSQPTGDATGPKIEQVWFSGVHSDVGGGYPERGLSDIPLLWMAQRARESGLALALDEVAPDPVGALHESRRGIYRLLPPHVRRIGAETGSRESVAGTAVARHRGDSRYVPRGLVDYLDGDDPRITTIDPAATT